MIIAAGYVYFSPKELENLVAEARKSIPIGLQNEGCISLSFTLEDKEKRAMLVFERWKNQAFQNKHLS